MGRSGRRRLAASPAEKDQDADQGNDDDGANASGLREQRRRGVLARDFAGIAKEVVATRAGKYWRLAAKPTL